jgi:hypothetical protein
MLPHIFHEAYGSNASYLQLFEDGSVAYGNKGKIKVTKDNLGIHKNTSLNLDGQLLYTSRD